MAGCDLLVGTRPTAGHPHLYRERESTTEAGEVGGSPPPRTPILAAFSPSLSYHLQPPAGEGGGGRTGKQLDNFRVSFFNIKKGLGGESVCYSALSCHNTGQ